MHQHDQENDTHSLCQHLISQLVPYTNCNQGGVFIQQTDADGLPYLSCHGAYAYGRQKRIASKIYAGEGLLGRCMQERDTLYLTEIPPNYIRITSGLGKALPRNIIILPVQDQDRFYGAIELAAFQVLQPYEVAFLEKVATAFAGILRSAFSKIKTQQLLTEANAMAQQLSSNEGKLRQQMEKLQHAQGHLERNKAELDGMVRSINQSLLTLTCNANGVVNDMNRNLQQLLGYSTGKAQHITQLLTQTGKAAWHQIHKQIAGLQTTTVTLNFATVGKGSVWLEATFNPIEGQQGAQQKTLMLATDVTEKRANQQELHRLSLLANNTSNAVLITDAGGFIQYVNAGFTQTSGYTLAEVLGKKPGHVLQGNATNPETVKRMRQHLQKGLPIKEEIINYHKNGMPYWVSLVINPAYNSQKQITNFVAIQADITETKKNDIKTAAQWAAINQANAVIELDMNGCITHVNNQLLNTLGVQAAELNGQCLSQFLTHNSQLSGATLIGTINKLAANQSITREFTLHGKSGNKCFRGVFYPIQKNLQKGYHKVIIVATDISQEKHHQQQLALKNHEIKEYLQAVEKTIGTLTCNPEGIITHINEIFLSITGFDQSELLGQHYHVLLDCDERQSARQHMLWQSIQDQNYVEGEFHIIGKTGDMLWFKGTYNPIADIDGNLTQVMLMAQFTTHEKKKLDELTTYVKTLSEHTYYIEMNPDYSIRSANKRFLEFKGLSRLQVTKPQNPAQRVIPCF